MDHIDLTPTQSGAETTVSVGHDDVKAAGKSRVQIVLLYNDEASASALKQELDQIIHVLPVQLKTAGALEKEDLAATILVSDWAPAELRHINTEKNVALNNVALTICVGGQCERHDDMIVCLDPSPTLAMQISMEIKSRLFPDDDRRRLALESENQRLSAAIQEIGRELSKFYHNINNPLTILSGNIQLLQLLADSIEISADVMKPIADIASISGRFSEDLQSIVELKEKIKSGRLQVGDTCTDM